MHMQSNSKMNHDTLRTLQFCPTVLGRILSAIMILLPTCTETTLSQAQAQVLEDLPEKSNPDCDSDSDSDCAGQYRNTILEGLVDLGIKTRIDHAVENASIGGDGSFFVVDLGQVSRQFLRWKGGLPGVQPYYAVKCNSDPTLLKYLAELGTGFDCASITEMRTILDLGIDPTQIIFANPCKSQSSLIFARKAGIFRTTFDNFDELDAISKHMPEAQLLLRIYANDDSALIPLGEKFGAHRDTVGLLLERVKELGLGFLGVSFHVGTGASNANSFCKAIKDARLAFRLAQKLGFNPTVLDIGGGFEDGSFEDMAASIREAISSEFPAGGISVIAEPGRFFARTAYTLVCQVISRRRQMGSALKAGIPDMLYQNDGVYGNFMNVIMEKEIMIPRLAGREALPGGSWDSSKRKEKKVESYKYSIWGPTCDSIDCVVREATFDCEVNVGDWLVYKNMGGESWNLRLCRFFDPAGRHTNLKEV